MTASLCLGAGGASAPVEPYVAVVETFRGSVAAGAVPLLEGSRFDAPAQVDARGGAVSLRWPATGTRIGAEGVLLRVVRAERSGVRVGVSDLRLDVEPGHQVDLAGQRAGGVRLRAGADNAASLTLGSCQTVVRLPPGAGASVGLDREGLAVRVQAESGRVEVLGREGRVTVLGPGEHLLDPCVPSPDGILDPPEARPPLTPYQP